MTIHKPSWFRDDEVMVSTAPTCGLAGGGRILAKIDPDTGKRMMTVDPDTGEEMIDIDDRLLLDVQALVSGETTDTLTFVSAGSVKLDCAVPTYFDRRFDRAFEEAMARDMFEGFTSMTLGEMVDEGLITTHSGHGSPSREKRVGTVPYIKVSDLRAGTVNVNPTNLVPRSVAEKYWRGKSSGLTAFDLICPERTSKNIGDFCVLMPGQEDVVLTREMIIVRPGPTATFDPFYLLWALTLKVVRDQWKRVIFMQTNREDVGDRYLEIRLPIAPDAATAQEVSAPFREYFTTLATAQESFAKYLEDGDHHFFVSGAPMIDDDELVELAQ